MNAIRTGPLARFTVLDLTRARSGPTAVRQLADWGADIIKIEEPGQQDGDGSPWDKRRGSDFQNLHRNKRSLTLNLKSEEGRAVLKRLVAKADVVVENYRPNVKIRLGIDYENLRALNPRIVYASISGFGQDGPYASRPGLDQVAQGMGGLMSITGLPGQGPVRAGIAIADTTAGLFCSIGILMALLDREHSGEGQWVQTSLLQAVIAMLDFQATRWLVDHEVPAQAGNDHPTGIPAGLFRTRDGHINIHASANNMFERLCNVIGAPELYTHPDYSNFKLRSKNREALHGAIGERLAQRSSAEWIEAFNKAGVPCGPVYTMDQVFADPQVRHIGMAQKVVHPILGELELLGQGVHLTRTPSQLRSAAPDRGEHSDGVLQEFGYSTSEIADLKSRGIV